MYQVEPSSFSASTHPLLESSSCPASAEPEHLTARTELVYQDALCINPEAQQQQAANEEQQPGGGSQILEYLSHWDFCNPARLGKRRSDRGSSRRQREAREQRAARDPRSRFTSRVPFHKKADVVDDLSWHLDHAHIMDPGGHHHHHHLSHQHPERGSERMSGSDGPSSSGGGGTAPEDGGTGGGGGNPPSMGPPSSVKNEREASALGTGGSINSPASLGTPVSVMTPKAPAPGSVRTPGDPASLSLMSPHQPPSNGPLTPMDTSGSSDQKPPRTPKSVPPPSYSVASPYTSVKSVERRPPDSIGGSSNVKQEEPPPPPPSVNGIEQHSHEDGKERQEQTGGFQLPSSSIFASSVSSTRPESTLPLILPAKRPALPAKEYEDDLRREDFLSDSVYDYRPIHRWLNHPVKRLRPSSELRQGVVGAVGGGAQLPHRPMYRRNSQVEMFLSRNSSFGGVASAVECGGRGGDLLSRRPEEDPANVVKQEVDQSAVATAAAVRPSANDDQDRKPPRMPADPSGERMRNGGPDDPYEFNDGVNGREVGSLKNPSLVDANSNNIIVFFLLAEA